MKPRALAWQGPGISCEDRIDVFIGRWAQSGAAEHANFQLFVSELCGLLGGDQLEPARVDAALNGYTLEHPVAFGHPEGYASTGRLSSSAGDLLRNDQRSGGPHC